LKPAARSLKPEAQPLPHLRNRSSSLAERYRISSGKHFRLKDIDPAETGGRKLKQQAEQLLGAGVARLSDAQRKLYAQDQWAVLVIFQAMDAAGKDSTIGHVMSGVNPLGVEVSNFKVPSAEELDHDFMWRTHRRLPERGRIGIFNRSYYEETLVVRVHPEYLESQHLPPLVLTKRIWEERFEDINAFERYLARNGVLILKFFLHLSKEEQRRRFVSRLTHPEKNWKFSASDVRERAFWDDYMTAYEETIRHTATKYAPWFVVPADNKWFTRLVVAEAIVSALEELNLAFPTLGLAKRKDLQAARRVLERERR
jgi:PPK2 family polyphosphate:nucleotide phosphotransferase